MSNAMFGRYMPGQSFVHKLDPRTKLTLSFAMIVILFLSSNWPSLAVCSIAVVAFFAAAKITPLQAFSSIAPLLFIIVLSAIFNVLYGEGGAIVVDLGWTKITTGGLEQAAFMSVRLGLLLLIGSLLTMTTTTFDITYGIESMLAPLTKMGVPVHEFAFVISTALQFLPQLAEEFDTIRMAQVARGAKLATTPLKGARAVTSLINPLFASVFRHADTLSLAMDARCYVPGAPRSRLYETHLGKRDALAFSIMAFICISVIFARFL